MSRTYSIGCEDCKVHLWVGQASYGDFQSASRIRIYSGGVETDRQKEFLETHRGHGVFLDENCEGIDSGEYFEVHDDADVAPDPDDTVTVRITENSVHCVPRHLIRNDETPKQASTRMLLEFRYRGWLGVAALASLLKDSPPSSATDLLRGDSNEEARRSGPAKSLKVNEGLVARDGFEPPTPGL
jgi:hypothetical protein